MGLSLRLDTDTGRVLYALQRAKGGWVADLYRETATMVHSRVADLREAGYVIECRCFGRADYRYRLIEGPKTQGGWPMDPEHYDERGMTG